MTCQSLCTSGNESTMSDSILKDKLASTEIVLKAASAMLHKARWQHFSFVSDLAKASKTSHVENVSNIVTESEAIEDVGYEVRRESSQLTIPTPQYFTTSSLGEPLNVGAKNEMQAWVRQGSMMRVQGLSCNKRGIKLTTIASTMSGKP